jgi:hypothetical protein
MYESIVMVKRTELEILTNFHILYTPGHDGKVCLGMPYVRVGGWLCASQFQECYSYSVLKKSLFVIGRCLVRVNIAAPELEPLLTGITAKMAIFSTTAAVILIKRHSTVDINYSMV